MSTGRWGSSLGLKEKEEKKRQGLRPEGTGRWGSSLRWDEEDEDEDVDYSDSVFSDKEKKEEKVEKEEEKKPGFFEKVGKGVKELFTGREKEQSVQEEKTSKLPEILNKLSNAVKVIQDEGLSSLSAVDTGTKKNIKKEGALLGTLVPLSDLGKKELEARKKAGLEATSNKVTAKELLIKKRDNPIEYLINRPYAKTDEGYLVGDIDKTPMEAMEYRLKASADFYNSLSNEDKVRIKAPDFINEDTYFYVAIEARDTANRIRTEIDVLNEQLEETSGKEKKQIKGRIEELQNQVGGLEAIEQGAYNNKNVIDAVKDFFTNKKNIPLLGGAFSAEEAIVLLNAYKKQDKGNPLNEREKMLIERDDRGETIKYLTENYDLGYEVTSGLLGSLSLMAEFVIAGSIFRALGLGAEGINLGTKGIGKIATGVAKTAVTAGQVTMTAGLGRIVTEATERQTPIYEYYWGTGESAKTKEGESPSEAWVKAIALEYGNNVIEVMFDGAGNADDIAKNLLRQGAIQGFPQEFSEEILQKFWEEAVIEKRKIVLPKDYVDPETQFTFTPRELVTIGVVTLTLGTISTALDNGEITQTEADIMAEQLQPKIQKIYDNVNGRTQEELKKELKKEEAKDPVDGTDYKNIIKEVGTQESTRKTGEELQKLSGDTESQKEAQFQIIQQSNPATEDNTHTWIRTMDDIKTFEETLEDSEVSYTPDYTQQMAESARESGTIEVFSSFPIENGVFVTPSEMEAKSYAGNGQVYSKNVALTDVAWIDSLQGQYAKGDGEEIKSKKEVAKGEKETKIAKESVVNHVVKLGTDDGNGSLEGVEEGDYILKQVRNEDHYIFKTMPIKEILKNKHNEEYAKAIQGNSDAFRRDRGDELEDNLYEPIILSHEGEIIDGIGRIFELLKRGEEEVNAYIGVKEAKVSGEDPEMDAIKKKMKTKLTPEEAALANKAIEEEVGGMEIDEYADTRAEDGYMYDMLEETRSMKDTTEKAKRIKNAAKSISPKASPDYTYTPEEAAARGRQIDLISPIDMVTMVEIANELSDKEIISILPKFRSVETRGQFKGDLLDPEIHLKASLFVDPKVAGQVMGHEIGHFVDYLPDRLLKGTFASKIAAVKNLARNFGEFKDATMRTEIYTLSRDYWRPYDEDGATESFVEYRKSSEELYADFISMLFVEPSILKKQAPTTLDAFIAFLEVKPAVKEAFYRVWDDLTATGIPDLDLRQKRVREMFDTAGSATWGLAGAQQVEKKFKIGAVVNSMINEAERLFVDVKQPLLKAERDYLKEMGGKLVVDKRPSKNIEALQALPAGEQAYITTYYEPINLRLKAHGMDFDDLGEWLFYNRIVNERGDITPQEVYDSLEGVSLTDLFVSVVAENPRGHLAKTIKALKEDILLTSLIEEDLEKGSSITEVVSTLMDGIIDSLYPGGVPRSKEATLFVKEFREKKAARLFSNIFPMKKGIANPLGFTTDTAQQQLDYMKEKMGEENFKLLEEIGGKDFRAGTMALVEMEGAEDYFGTNKIEMIKKNKDYATFSVNHYLNAHISPKIREQKGTVKTIMNPAHATAIKNVQMYKAIEYNNARKSAVDFLVAANLPDAQIESAPMKYDANVGFAVPDMDKIERMKNKALMMTLRDGKPKYHIMDQKMRDAIYEDVYKIPDSWGLVKDGFKALSWLNTTWYKPVYVGWNIAFNIYNVQKDFIASWQNNPYLNLGEALLSYAKNTKQVWDSVMFRRDSETILELKRNKFLIGQTRADVYSKERDGLPLNVFDLYETESSFVPVKDMPTGTAKEKWEVTKRIVGNAEKFMNFTEMLPKVSGAVALKEKDIDLTNKEMADLARNYIGSPLFTNKGFAYEITNTLLLFSNATKEGLKRSVEIVSGSSPTGAKGVWKKLMRASVGIAITTLLYLMRNQLPPFEGEEFEDIAEFLKKIPKRDITSYIPIPFGTIGGKATYFPMGRTEEEQLMNAIVWSVLDMIYSKDSQEASEAFKGAFQTLGGEIPSLHPIIHSALAIWKTSNGENPYDAFRGRNIFSPYTFDYMPEDEKAKVLIKYLVAEQGLNIFQRTYDPRSYGEEPNIIERGHRIPVLGNPLYRIVRSTNFGEVEAEWEEKRLSDKTSRKEKTKTINMMNADAQELVEKNASLKEIKGLLKTYQEAAIGSPEPKKGYTGDDKRKATDARKLFKKEIVRESGKLPSWRVLDMSTNDQKTNQLLRDREGLSEKEFENYLYNLRISEVISDEFVKTFFEKGYITKKEYESIMKGDRTQFHPFR